MGQQGDLRRTVLLVEADQNLARLIGHALRDSRFVVTEVNTGQEALEVLETQYPDAVVMDPDLVDGAGPALVERCRRIRQEEGQAMVWVIISTMDRAEAIQCYGSPLRSFLAKPFDPWDLAKLLEQELSNRTLALERYRQQRARRRARDNFIGSLV